MHLDRRLTWQRHLEAKQTQAKLQFSKLYWMLGKNSKLSIDHKILIFNMIIKPIWCYGIQLWGTASKSSIEKIQKVQSKILRTICGAPWYVKNKNIHNDLKIDTINEEINKCSTRYSDKLRNHPNNLASELLNRNYIKRLKRSDTHDIGVS